MTRMTAEKENDRARLENVMFWLRRKRDDLRITQTRVKQARERAHLGRLLDPALDDLEELSQAIDQTEELLSDFWKRDWR